MHVVGQQRHNEDRKEILAHERLDVYGVALAFLELVEPLLGKLPRTKGQLGDQLGRASESIVLRIAEGAGAEWRSADQKRYFRNARGSALECASCLDVCRIRRIAYVPNSGTPRGGRPSPWHAARSADYTTRNPPPLPAVRPSLPSHAHSHGPAACFEQAGRAAPTGWLPLVHVPQHRPQRSPGTVRVRVRGQRGA